MSKTWPAVAVRFIAPRECIVEEETVAAANLSGGQFVLETECSIVSVGTEVANYSGIDPTVFVPGAWNAYPSTPGYGAVGRVLAVSPEGASRPICPRSVKGFSRLRRTSLSRSATSTTASSYRSRKAMTPY